MKVSPKQAITIGLMALLAFASLFVLFSDFASARNGSGGPVVVVLTASWCGTCREVTPAVKRVVEATPGVSMVTLDVDDSSAHSQANSYGINVTGSDVPQVYLFNNGKTVSLFTGKGYKFGQSKVAEEQIRQKLQSNL